MRFICGSQINKKTKFNNSSICSQPNPTPTPSPSSSPKNRAFTSPCSLQGDIVITNITDFTNTFNVLNKVFYINSSPNVSGFNGCAYLSDLNPNISNYVSLGIPIYEDNGTHTFDPILVYPISSLSPNMDVCVSDHPCI